MKTLMISTLTAILACGVVAIEAYAQKGAGQPQGIARQAKKPELVTLVGVVVEVKSGPCANHRPVGSRHAPRHQNRRWRPPGYPCWSAA